MRIFVALDVPPPLKTELGDALDGLAGNYPEFRWIDEENLHITLAFLDELDARHLTLLAEAVEEAACYTEPLSVRLGETRTLPAGKQARTLVLGFAAGGEKIAALAARIERNLARLAKYEAYPFPLREKRPFTPHLTIARKKQAEAAPFPAESCALGGGEAVLTQVSIYESRLLSAGAEYTARASFPLKKIADEEGDTLSP